MQKGGAGGKQDPIRHTANNGRRAAGSGGDKRQQRTVWAIESASHLAEQRPRRHRILKLELGLDLEQPDQWVGGQLKLRRCQELDRLDVHGLG